MRKFQLLILLVYSSLLFAEEPTVVHLGKIGETDLSAILPSEKAMIFLAIALQVIWKLVTYIFKKRIQSEDKTEEKLDRLYKMVHDMQVDVRSLKNAPTEDQLFNRLLPHIKLTVIEAIRKYKGGDKS